eukprot:3909095-Prymnesium_polylepis.1
MAHVRGRANDTIGVPHMITIWPISQQIADHNSCRRAADACVSTVCLTVIIVQHGADFMACRYRMRGMGRWTLVITSIELADSM